MVNGAEQAHANKVVATAVERGVNYFDVAPTYGDAESMTSVDCLLFPAP